MNTKENLLGIDLGTSSVKAVITDSSGILLGSGSKEYPIDIPKPGYAEQDPEIWWNAVVYAVTESIQKSGAGPDSIAGIGIDGQMHAPVMLDRRGKPVRPVIIWADQRADKESEELINLIGRDTFGTIAGTAPCVGFMAPTLLWIKRNEQESLDATSSCILPKDYIRLKLTGEIAVEASDASATALFDIRRRDWSDKIINKIGLPRDIFPEVLEPVDRAGELTKTAAERLGLKRGIPVAAGSADQVTQAIGNGLSKPGDCFIALGSGGQLVINTAEPVANPDLNVHVFCHAEQKFWYVLGAMLTAGLSLRWFRDLLGWTERENAFELLSEAAGNVSPGAENLIFLPYLAGERSPIMDPKAKGVFTGLTLGHGRGHLSRAIMEGVACAFKHILETVMLMGLSPNRIIATGNGLAAPLWRQITADILGVPLYLSGQKEQSARGAAFLGGIAGGMYNNIEEVSLLIPDPTEITEPGSQNGPVYTDLYERFKELYPVLKPNMHR
jgi:xylulokinase